MLNTIIILSIKHPSQMISNKYAFWIKFLTPPPSKKFPWIQCLVNKVISK